MSLQFTQSDVINYTKERDWSSNLGMLDWDSTNIVFTKRSLIEFLRYTGTTVDTNFFNIQKLPKYATFGKFSKPLPKPLEVVTEDLPATENKDDAFVPTRRVKQPPGGPHTDIFGTEFQPGVDALHNAPPPDEPETTKNTSNQTQEPSEEAEEEGIPFSSRPVPSRRVRENPGGTSSLGVNFWEGGADEFKPTRRVRQAPGGEDHIF